MTPPAPAGRPPPRRPHGRVAPFLAMLILSLAAPGMALSAGQDADPPWPPAAASVPLADTVPPLEQLSVLRRARRASAAGEFRRARSLWEEVVSANPYRSEAWLEVAEARARTGDMSGGFEALRRALEIGLPVPRGRVLFEAVGILAAAGRVEMATEWLGRALEAGY